MFFTSRKKKDQERIDHLIAGRKSIAEDFFASHELSVMRRFERQSSHEMISTNGWDRRVLEAEKDLRVSGLAAPDFPYTPQRLASFRLLDEVVAKYESDHPELLQACADHLVLVARAYKQSGLKHRILEEAENDRPLAVVVIDDTLPFAMTAIPGYLEFSRQTLLGADISGSELYDPERDPISPMLQSETDALIDAGAKYTLVALPIFYRGPESRTSRIDLVAQGPSIEFSSTHGLLPNSNLKLYFDAVTNEQLFHALQELYGR